MSKRIVGCGRAAGVPGEGGGPNRGGREYITPRLFDVYSISGLPTGRVGVNVNSRGRLMRRNQLSPGQIRTSKIVHSQEICGYSGNPRHDSRFKSTQPPRSNVQPCGCKGSPEILGLPFRHQDRPRAERAPLSVLVFSSSPPPRVKHWN